MSSFTSFSSENRQEFESRYTTDTKKRRYNVFLSFCARDAGTFPSRLDMALSSEAGIVVFGDVERVQHGEWEKLALDVIEDCKIAIVIFSTNYVNLSLYLKELEKITECCRTLDLTVLPVFYHSVHSSYGCSEGGMLEGGAFNYFLDRMMVEGITEEEDKFITWVTGITKATKYLGPSNFTVETSLIQNFILYGQPF
ncbi:disease resistance protein RPV1 [Trifolium repens]|nr:disease resistance protein RPV1 [Trifolium repens]